jgi:monoamine oxidase
MADNTTDVIVIGAGVAGLAAAEALAAAGLRISVLEARDRTGGRIWTVRDGIVPVELGAEFIHGKPPQVFGLLTAAGVTIEEVSGQPWCVEDGALGPCQFFTEVEDIFRRMEPPPATDESFVDFLRRCCATASAEARRRATEFVEGFHAAPADRVSVQSLVRGDEADREIDGDSSFRLPDGYEVLVRLLQERMLAHGAVVQLNTTVCAVRWRNGAVEVRAEQAGATSVWTAPAIVVTLPLGLLQAGGVQFEPSLREKRDALAKLAMGAAIRVTMQFRERFWECLKDGLGEMSFLFSHDPAFPTWWTLLPRRAPVLTGWCAGPRGERMSHHSRQEIVGAALQALARILGLREERIKQLVERSWSHNWETDPFSRGAYSHVLVGGEGTQQALAEPLARTLFFAGEATDWTGHHSTVHGAFASGRRTAEAVLKTR